jgi:hypothetical protein
VSHIYRWDVPKVLTRRLARIRDRTGVPVTRQLRAAVVEYLDEHDVPAQVVPRATRSTTITASRGVEH